jgi:acetyl-CoA acetyltransferase
VKKIKIKRAFNTRFGRLDHSFVELMLQAADGVLQGIDIERISDVYVAAYAPAQLCGITDPLAAVRNAIAEHHPGIHARYRGMYRTGGNALFEALASAGREDARDVLVIGAEKMTHLRPAETAGILATRENAHDRRYGATLPALGGLVTGAYLERHGVPVEALHLVSVKNHRNGALNPKAHFQKPVTVEAVAESPLVADPLRRLHCAPVSDGASALVLSPEDGDVALTGWGKGVDTPLFQDRRDITRFVATARAAETARAMANVQPADVDVVEIHDAFASFELINMEEMAFYEAGSSWRALTAGEFDIGARRAVNPSGGKKAKGHPIGTTGISSAGELVEQLTGTAGARQQPNARVGMAQSVGGVARDSYVFVVEAL